MKLSERLEQEFDYNAMMSQCGVLNLFHSDAKRNVFACRANAVRTDGVDAKLVDSEAVYAMACISL